MRLDVDRLADVVLAGTQALIAKAIAPLRDENDGLKALADSLHVRVLELEGRPVPVIATERAISDEEISAIRAGWVEISAKAEEAVAKADAVGAAVAALEAPSLPDVPALVAEAVAAAVDALPKPQDGKDADPAEIDAILAELADVRRSIPEPVAPPDLSGFATKDDLAALPQPKDWSGDIAEVRAAVPLIPDLSGFALKSEVEAVRAAIPAVPEPKDFTPQIDALSERLDAIRIPEAIPGKDGLGIAEVKQNADGELIVKMTSGETVNAGKVRGADGMGFDDMAVEYDGERTIALVLTRGDRVLRKEIVLPIVLDRGIWKEGTTYVRGDSISYGGSTFIVQVDETTARPETSKDWRLAVKRGRDGKSDPVKR